MRVAATFNVCCDAKVPKEAIEAFGFMVTSLTAHAWKASGLTAAELSEATAAGEALYQETLVHYDP